MLDTNSRAVHIANRDRENVVLRSWFSTQNTAESVIFSTAMMEARVAA